MRVAFSLLGREVFAIAVNEPDPADEDLVMVLDPDDDEDEGPVFEPYQDAGVLETTVVESTPGSTWEDRGSLHQFEDTDRRSRRTRTSAQVRPARPTLGFR